MSLPLRTTLSAYLARFDAEFTRDTTRAYLIDMASPEEGGQSVYQGRFLRGGVLLFTPETADLWAGPFPGGAAAFKLLDWRKTLRRVMPRQGVRRRAGQGRARSTSCSPRGGRGTWRRPGVRRPT